MLIAAKKLKSNHINIPSKGWSKIQLFEILGGGGLRGGGGGPGQSGEGEGCHQENITIRTPNLLPGTKIISVKRKAVLSFHPSAPSEK